jgi:hypothetical protein
VEGIYRSRCRRHGRVLWKGPTEDVGVSTASKDSQSSLILVSTLVVAHKVYDVDSLLRYLPCHHHRLSTVPTTTPSNDDGDDDDDEDFTATTTTRTGGSRTRWDSKGGIPTVYKDPDAVGHGGPHPVPWDARSILLSVLATTISGTSTTTTSHNNNSNTTTNHPILFVVNNNSNISNKNSITMDGSHHHCDS